MEVLDPEVKKATWAASYFYLYSLYLLASNPSAREIPGFWISPTEVSPSGLPLFFHASQHSLGVMEPF